MDKNNGIDYQKRFDTFIDGLVLQAQNKAIKEYDIDEIRETDPDEANNRIFLARTTAIKQIQNVIAPGLWKRFEKELSYSKEDIFPRHWMSNHKGIQQTMERYTMLMPLLNTIFNQNRYVKQKDVDHLQTYANGHTINGHPISLFITNSTFNSSTIKKLNCSKRHLQKYIKGLLHLDIFKKIGNDGINGQIILDGYYTKFKDNFIKHSVVKKDGKCVQALKKFTIIN